MKIAKLYLWQFVERDGGALALKGNVSGHPRFPDGSCIQTSKLCTLDPEERIAVTMNTVYVLVGPPAEVKEK